MRSRSCVHASLLLSLATSVKNQGDKLPVLKFVQCKSHNRYSDVICNGDIAQELYWLLLRRTSGTSHTTFLGIVRSTYTTARQASCTKKTLAIVIAIDCASAGIFIRVAGFIIVYHMNGTQDCRESFVPPLSLQRPIDAPLRGCEAYDTRSGVLICLGPFWK